MKIFVGQFINFVIKGYLFDHISLILI